MADGTVKRNLMRWFFPLALLALMLILPGSAMAAGPVLDVSAEASPTQVAPGDKLTYSFSVDNLGTDPTAGDVIVSFELPPGVTATEQLPGNEFFWSCPAVAGESVVSCRLEIANFYSTLPFNSIPEHASTGFSLLINATVDSDASPGTRESTVTVSGGGAQDRSQSVTTRIAPQLPGFGISFFGARFVNDDGSIARQAGSHPDFTTTFSVNDLRAVTAFSEDGAIGPVDNFKDVDVDLPPGMVGDPTAYPTCSVDALNASVGEPLCPPESQVGIALVKTRTTFGIGYAQFGLYNVTAPIGSPGRFSFNVAGVIINLEPRVRADGNYSIAAHFGNTSQSLPVISTMITLWGVPADPVHARQRFLLGEGWNADNGAPTTAALRPFFSMPTECTGQPLTTSVKTNSWGDPATFEKASFDHDTSGNPVQMQGCNQLDFAPTIEARPTTDLADSPSGLDVRLHIPQSEDPKGLATAHLRDATITLPAGMTVNPSSAQGLAACSPSQIGLTSPVGDQGAKFNEAANTCPDAAKLGTVQIDTPLLDHPLKGGIYLATQNQNPFNSLLALYIAVEDPQTGITIKLAGQPVPDPKTGQLTVAFKQNPQLPFEDLKVNLFTGPRASLKTPLACGQFTSTSTMVPWSAPEGESKSPSDTFTINQGAGKGACLKSDSEAPNRPSFSAGASDPAAGAFTPFVLKVTRADGTAPIKAIDATLPKGLLGKLAGIPYCSDGALASAAAKSGKDEQASASCPAASQVGSVEVGAGAGSNPLYVSGKAYLAGPYKGAPLSLGIVTPAVAGPFDLGTVVVRTKLEVNPETAQIHAVSDEIPTILQGIPLDVRQIAVNMDKPRFTLNPTNCDPMSVDGSALSVFGQSASLSNRFQVGGCAAMGFKPKLAIDLKGATRRAAYPALTAILKARPGDANIGKAVVTLPHSAFLAQNHIKTICTRVQFAADQCPAGSVYGKATATTPLLEQPLSGPVYLRSSSNKLPDLVVALRGQIDIDLVGRIDSVKGGGIRTSFETVPDAPVSKFTLRMAGGKKSLLMNSRNLCNRPNKANVELDGQGGQSADSRPLISNDCKVKKKTKGKKSKGKRGARR